MTTAAPYVPDLESLDPALDLRAEILRLKRSRNAVILAHNYMTPEIFHGVAFDFEPIDLRDQRGVQAPLDRRHARLDLLPDGAEVFDRLRGDRVHRRIAQPGDRDSSAGLELDLLGLFELATLHHLIELQLHRAGAFRVEVELHGLRVNVAG